MSKRSIKIKHKGGFLKKGDSISPDTLSPMTKEQREYNIFHQPLKYVLPSHGVVVRITKSSIYAYVQKGAIKIKQRYCRQKYDRIMKYGSPCVSVNIKAKK